MRISLCMIVRQEEKALERCLEGIADAVEEIVIVDMGSTDRTKEIARQFTDKIYDFPWVDDFAAARNFAFSKGTGEYLLWMDAEDILPSGEKEKLLALKADLRENPCDMVMMLFDRGVDEGGRTKFSCYRERLVRRCPQARWQGRANEVIPPFGSVRYEEIHFVRRKEKQKYSDCNLWIYEKMLADKNFSAKELSAVAHGYTLILQESTMALKDLQDVITPTGMSMTDKERLDRIDGVHAELMRNRNLAAYHTRKTIGVSMVRSKKRNDMERVMSLYGKDEDKYW